jgi:hypothetical protein
VGFVAVLDRLALAHALRAASATPPVTIVVGLGTDGAVVTSDPEAWFTRRAKHVGGKDVGEKTPREQYVPIRPFPGQATTPCMDEEGEITINGGCYMPKKVKPPPAVGISIEAEMSATAQSRLTHGSRPAQSRERWGQRRPLAQPRPVGVPLGRSPTPTGRGSSRTFANPDRSGLLRNQHLR